MRRAFGVFVLVCAALSSVAPAGAASANDYYFSLQWGLAKIGGPAAWSVSQGKGVIVAIVDTGVDLGHPDLRGQLVAGHDFVDNNEQPMDQNGHGTLMAGIIAAVTNNMVGVASVAPRARIMPVRVLGKDGTGTATVVAAGITWAWQHGASVINLSLALEAGQNNGPLLKSPQVDGAIKAAAAAGAVVVVAAGNTSTGGRDQTAYDATVPGVIVVGASAKDGRPAAYSDHGGGLDLLAPGGGSSSNPGAQYCTQDQAIVSTWWNPTTHRSSYGGGCGTSMSVAFTSGVAALLRARGLDNAGTVDRIEKTATDYGAKGRDDLSGWGILNAARAVGARGTTPATNSGGSVRAHPTPTRITAAGSARAVPSSSTKKKPSLPTVNAVRPLDIRTSQREAVIAIAAALVCVLIAAHAIRAARKPRGS